MQTPLLYLMLGYPGAGKTTVSRIIAELTDAVLLSSDELRAEMFKPPLFSQTEHDLLYGELNSQTERLLKAGKSVIYDANLNRYEHREEKYDICSRTGAKAALIWLDTPRSLAKDRARHTSRQHLWPPGETPEAMFERIAQVIEPPRDDEPVFKMDGTDAGKQAVKDLLERITAA